MHIVQDEHSCDQHRIQEDDECLAGIEALRAHEVDKRHPAAANPVEAQRCLIHLGVG